jgi:hypothetical protein
MKLKKKFQIELLTMSNYTNQIKTLRTIALHEQHKLTIIHTTHCSLQLKVGTTFFPIINYTTPHWNYTKMTKNMKIPK